MRIYRDMHVYRRGEIVGGKMDVISKEASKAKGSEEMVLSGSPPNIPGR